MRLSPSIYLVGGSSIGLTRGGDAHIYLVRGPSGLFLIDSGTGRCVDDLVDSIKHEGFKPEDITHILMTHHHQDHTGGAKELRERFGCEVWICDDPGKHLLEKGTMDDLGYTFGIEKGLIPEDLPFRHCPVAHGIADGEEFAIGGVSITAIKTIGHSPDSMCFEMELDGLQCLFCGDTVLFGGVVGMINYPWSSLEDFHTGLPRLLGRDIDALFPGHGYFCLRNGQTSIDDACRKLRTIFVPQLVGQIHDCPICYNQDK